MDRDLRRLIAFDCAGETLAGTLDAAEGTTGLLIVSGGNEIRVGAHRGMALLAQRLADEGVPVFRYDRRGIGDSTGTNGGFESSVPDLAAALAAFRTEMPQLARIVAFGNCDAASALALFHDGLDIDALVLANPWIGAESDSLPAAAAIRARYGERMRDPRQWARLLRGGVDLRKLVKGLTKIIARQPQQEAPLVSRIGHALSASGIAAIILLARRDNGALAFADAWRRLVSAPPLPIHERDSASHSFATAADKDWLHARLSDVLR